MCGEVAGAYIDHSHAIVNGNGISLGFAQSDIPTAEYYTKSGRSVAVRCWARPHEGIGNPNQKIVPNKLFDMSEKEFEEFLYGSESYEIRKYFDGNGI